MLQSLTDFWSPAGEVQCDGSMVDIMTRLSPNKEFLQEALLKHFAQTEQYYKHKSQDTWVTQTQTREPNNN